MTSNTSATASEAKERAGDVKETATQQAAEVGGTIKEQSGQVVHEATAQARNLMEEARAQVREQAAVQQSRIRTLLEEFADELEHMAQAGGRDGLATEVVRQVAAKTRSVTSGIGSADGGDVLESLRSFARRRPGTFLFGAAFAGVLAGRATRSAKELRSAGSAGQSAQPIYAPQSGQTLPPAGTGTYAGAGAMAGGAEGVLGEPVVTQNYVAPRPVTVDLTSVEGDQQRAETDLPRPGDETEWAPVASRSATDRYPEENR